MTDSKRPPILAGDIAWCLHCERAYQKGEGRPVKGLLMCPYPGCDGDTVLDQWKWSHVRKSNSTYPAVPVRGELYPLYGKDKP